MPDEIFRNQQEHFDPYLSPEGEATEKNKVVVVASLEEAESVLNQIVGERDICIRGIISSTAGAIDLSRTEKQSNYSGPFAEVVLVNSVPEGEQRRKVVENVQTIIQSGSELTPDEDGTIHTRVERYNPEMGVTNRVFEALDTYALESAISLADKSKGAEGEAFVERAWEVLRPTILIYDNKKIRPSGGNYGVTLEPQNAETAVLMAIVIDAESDKLR